MGPPPEEGAEDLPEKQREMGTIAFLHWLDETLSNSFRVVPPCATLCGELDRICGSSPPRQ